MIYVFVLLTGIFPFTRQSEGTESIIKRIPEVIDVFCPGNNVCRENRSTNATSVNFTSIFRSCCTECHCQMNCTEDNTCCFPPKRPTLMKENGWQIGRECLFPSSANQSAIDPVLHKSFYMVTSVTETMKTGQTFDSNIQCGDDIVAPWGSIFPLYSSVKEEIYKNAVCAEAHGVSDGILWDAVLECSMTTIGASVSTINIDSDVFPKDCTVNFIPPFETRQMKTFQCYRSLQHFCLESEFDVPYETGLSKLDIIKMCESNFLSPFMNQYANVFCYICSQKVLLTKIFCNDTSEPDRGSLKSGFFGLIDTTILILHNREIKHAKTLLLACKSKDASNCRPVLCPSFQIRDKSGTCQFLNNIWYNQEYVININLILEKNIGIHEMYDIEGILPGMTASVPKRWIIESILYEVNDQTRNGTSLVVILRYNSPKVRPKYLMKTILKIFKSKWKLHLGNDTLSLKSSFTKVYNVYKYYINQTEYETDHDPSMAPMYYELYFNGIFTGNTHIISKLYFCDQVEINSSEFSVNIDETCIFVKKTQRYLFDAEFLLLKKDDKIARICVKDAGMFVMRNESWRISVEVCLMYIIIFVHIIIEF